MDVLAGAYSGSDESPASSPKKSSNEKSVTAKDGTAHKTGANLDDQWEMFEKLVGESAFLPEDGPAGVDHPLPTEDKTNVDDEAAKQKSDESAESSSESESSSSEDSSSGSSSSDSEKEDEEGKKKKEKHKNGSQAKKRQLRKRTKSTDSESEDESNHDGQTSDAQMGQNEHRVACDSQQDESNKVPKETPTEKEKSASPDPKAGRSRSRSRSRTRRSRSRDRRRRRRQAGSRRVRRSRSKGRRRRRRRSRSRNRRSRSRHRSRTRDRQKNPSVSDATALNGDKSTEASGDAANKAGDRKRSRSRDRRKSRSRSNDRKRRRSGDRRRRRRRSHSRERRRRRSRDRGRRRRSRSRNRGRHRRSPSPRTSHRAEPDLHKRRNEPLNFKEKLKQSLMEVQKKAASGQLDINKMQMDAKNMETANEKPSHLPLGSDNPLAAMAAGGHVTPQQALLQTMAAMHQKAQELTGVAVPKYYNPAAVNPLKYAEQVQKRKLLWSKSRDKKEPEAPEAIETVPTSAPAGQSSSAAWAATAFAQDQDGKMSAKFRKLMGIKQETEVDDAEKLSEEQIRKQKELFQRLDQEYEMARMSTHTHRGVGLGFASATQHVPQFPK